MQLNLGYSRYRLCWCRR